MGGDDWLVAPRLCAAAAAAAAAVAVVVVSLACVLNGSLVLPEVSTINKKKRMGKNMKDGT